MRLLNPAVRAFIALTLFAGLSVPASAFVDKPWHFKIGGGYTPVVGGMDSQLEGGWNFAIGTEYSVTEKFGLLFEYGSHNGGIEQGILNRYSAVLGGIATDGYLRVWSLTLNPTWKFELNDVVGGYLIGGGGYYHANAQVTTPGVAYLPGYCDPWWGCWGGGFVEADKIVAERKDDTGGVNVGVGFTFDFWSGTQFFVESRYHYILIHGPDLQLLPFTAGFRF